MLPTPVSLADHIYSESEQQLMAHSIRAVQHHIFTFRKSAGHSVEGSVYPITLFSGPVDTAKLVVRTRSAMILIPVIYDDHVRIRRAIAHELAHLLLAAHHASDAPDFMTFRQDAVTEDECDAFAAHLCAKHDEFYSDHDKIAARCRFTTDP